MRKISQSHRVSLLPSTSHHFCNVFLLTIAFHPAPLLLQYILFQKPGHTVLVIGFLANGVGVPLNAVHSVFDRHP